MSNDRVDRGGPTDDRQPGDRGVDDSAPQNTTASRCFFWNNARLYPGGPPAVAFGHSAPNPFTAPFIVYDVISIVVPGNWISSCAGQR